MVKEMPQETKNDMLVNLEAQRDAIRYATGSGSNLKGILAAISAAVTKERAERLAAKSPPITAIRPLQIDVIANENSWPESIPFPLTPLEAWNLLRGYSIKPTKPISREDLDRLPLDIEDIAGYLRVNYKSAQE